jgi:hypothetical protein
MTLATVFGVMLNWSAAAALVKPPSITLRTIALDLSVVGMLTG